MQWKDLTPLLSKAAPILGTLIGGPAGTAIGGVISAALNVSNTPDAVSQAITADPNAVVKLQQIAADRERDLMQIHLQAVQADFADRASARSRDVEIIQAGGKNTRADAMVIGAVVGLIACLAVLVVFRAQIPGEAVGIISTIAGIFGSCLKDAYAFEFGSSKGSKDKDQILATLVKS